jgi:hypothetical protein
MYVFTFICIYLKYKKIYVYTRKYTCAYKYVRVCGVRVCVFECDPNVHTASIYTYILSTIPHTCIYSYIHPLLQNTDMIQSSITYIRGELWSYTYNYI